MNRRAFLSGVTLGLFATPLAAEAQTAGKTARVGWLALGPHTGQSAGLLRRVPGGPARARLDRWPEPRHRGPLGQPRPGARSGG